MSQKITAIIVGAGHRSLLYSQYALEHPEDFQITGVADPNPLRRRMAAEMHHIPAERCFESAEQLAEQPKLADAIINGTMDSAHVATSIPLLRLGYDMLLEKPFAINEQEMWELHRAVRETGRRVMICHVLRYAPFYREIKQRLMAGEIGQIINIQATEHVSYHHYSVSYLRGKWRSEQECGASMLLAKCCHDIDLIMWLKSGVMPRQVASFGGDFQFNPGMKPQSAGTRCMVDCPIEGQCLYSAKKLHIDHPERWSFYVWDDTLIHKQNPTLADKQESLRTDNPHGLCAWDCGHAVVDHQSVMLQFADSATATLNMVGGTAKPERNLHIIGTLGEIKGTFDDSIYTIRKIDHAQKSGWSEQTVDLAIGGDKSGMTGSHGGGDLCLVEDFVRLLQGKEPSISCTRIEDSVNGHLAVFLADKARKEGGVQLFPAL